MSVNLTSDCRFIRINVFITLLTVVLVRVGYSGADSANLVINGSFEEATYNPWQPTAWTFGIEGSAHGALSCANDGFHGPVDQCWGACTQIAIDAGGQPFAAGKEFKQRLSLFHRSQSSRRNGRLSSGQVGATGRLQR